MLETPHAIVGAAIAARIPNPIISIPLAFASHFVLDLTPHWNPHINTELKKYGHVTVKSKAIIFADVLFAGMCVLALANAKPEAAMNIFLGSAAGIMPDVVEGPYFFLGIKNKFINMWLKFQKSIQTDVPLIPGIVTQITVIAVALWWFISL